MSRQLLWITSKWFGWDCITWWLSTLGAYQGGPNNSTTFLKGGGIIRQIGFKLFNWLVSITMAYIGTTRYIGFQLLLVVYDNHGIDYKYIFLDTNLSSAEG